MSPLNFVVFGLKLALQVQVSQLIQVFDLSSFSLCYYENSLSVSVYVVL